ncbi:MAG: hypothetical protein IAG13_12705 [Deltaproteobacteria bacterium]|nr:hypothetical protein [Nannocystaceae bacterium]
MTAHRFGLALCSTAATLLLACQGGDDAAGVDDGSSGSSSEETSSSLETTASTTISTTETQETTDPDPTTGPGTSTETGDHSSSDGSSAEATSTEAGSTESSEAGSTESSEAGSTESSDEGSSSSTGEVVEDPFPPSPAFGTNVLDLDLVGTWGLNWEPETGFDSVIEISDAGDFVWLETSADCTTTTEATGHLWVEGVQVVMHVDTWERPLPWDTEAVLGESFAPPFRLRMSFSLQGGGGNAYLTLAAPSRVTEAAPYDGSSYVRTVEQGLYLGGTWRGESELQAVPEGETEPVTIVRDVYQAFLDPETDALDPQGSGTRSTSTTYFPIPQASYSYAGGNWTCLGGCPVGSGLTLVNGDNVFTYGPYAGYEHLLSFADGQTFRRDVGTDCP